MSKKLKGLSQSFPRTLRIRKRPEILKLQESGSKAFSRHFLLIVKPGSNASSRIAITVTRKIDKRAVGRNRLKRRVREIFRRNHNRLAQSFDILVIARKNAVDLPLSEIQREILGALHHNGYLKNQNATR